MHRIDELYSAADLTLSPAYSHAGMAEAVAFVPMVAGKGLYQREYIIDGNTGILCDHNVDSYASALIYLLTSDSRREQYANASQKRLDEKFSIDRGVLRLMAQYMRLA